MSKAGVCCLHIEVEVAVLGVWPGRTDVHIIRRRLHRADRTWQ